MGNLTGIYICPDCGKTVSFKNAVNNLAVCQCGKVWRTTEKELAPVDIAVINVSGDIIQPGTSGIWNGQNFTVLGRFRIWFDESAYNYWTIDMHDGVVRYLAEGYGMYSIHEPIVSAFPLTSKKFNSYSKSPKFDLNEYPKQELTRFGESLWIELEGVSYMPEITKKVKSIEAISANGAIEIIEFGNDCVFAYTAHFVDFEELQLTNLRELASQGRSFSCKKCGTNTNVTTFPYAQSWVCGQCFTKYSITLGESPKDEGVNMGHLPAFNFAIGATLSVHAVNYTVIGRALKQDGKYKDDQWKEYTLYNPKQGYRFLTESDGHWMLLKETRKSPLPSQDRYQQIFFEGKKFERFLRYKYVLLFGEGEFPGNVFADEGEIATTDYISPPEILSIETRPEGGGVSWFRGEYLPPKLIGDQASGSFPYRSGIAPAQPKLMVDTPTLVTSGFCSLVLLLIVQFFSTLNCSETTIVNSTYTFADSVYAQTFMTPKFKLNKWKSNLQLDINSPVNNSWFELNASLINVKDGTEYTLEQGVEYYWGREDGENWSEGGTNETAFFTSIPAGTYFLQFTGVREFTNTDMRMTKEFSVKVVNDTPAYLNIMIALGVILIIPIIVGMVDYYYEKERWENSPYSTFS